MWKIEKQVLSLNHVLLLAVSSNKISLLHIHYLHIQEPPYTTGHLLQYIDRSVIYRKPDQYYTNILESPQDSRRN